MIRQALAGLSVTKGRSFKVELWVEGEKLADGDVALHIEEADGDTSRTASQCLPGGRGRQPGDLALQPR